MKRLQALIAMVGTFIIFGSVASAHVVVKPAEVLTGAFQTFTMSVPDEKDIATVKLKLTLPKGLQDVSPTVKNGWTITTDKSGDGDDAVVTSITWDGGSIPGSYRDDFTFSAKVPDSPTSLDWKAYQTYADGTTVSWDQQPTANEADNDNAPVGPFSVTSVVKDATTSATTTSNSSDWPKYVSVAALAVALLAFGVATRRHTK